MERKMGKTKGNKNRRGKTQRRMKKNKKGCD